MAYRYTYVDLLNVIKDIDDTRLNYAGNWNPNSQYFPFDVVLYNNTRYICLAPTQGDTPTVVQVRDDHWSALVFVSTGSSQPGDIASQAYAIATDALRIAIIGTNLGQQAYTIGVTALYTAWYGTSLAQQAYDLALLALEGGGTGSGTLCQEAYGLAMQALHMAWVGTQSGDQAYNVAMDAYRLAVQGTLTPVFDVDTILTTVYGNIVVNSSGNVVVSGGF